MMQKKKTTLKDIATRAGVSTALVSYVMNGKDKEGKVGKEMAITIKAIAKELGVAQRTVERYRSDISRKLGITSIAEIARLVQLAGLEIAHADMPRLNRWHGKPE
jgi:LacI family transcriptional regulator